MTLSCIVGLGNPGKEYTLNRHNVGFLALDEIVGYYKCGEWKVESKLSFLKAEIEGHKIIFVKPMTYMNRSGIVLAEVLKFYKIALDRVLVLHDDLDLDLGRLKLKKSGGNGGHNGLRSIDAHCGQDYWRLRIGIGHPGQKEKVHNHVLSDFTRHEYEVLEPKLDRSCFSIPMWLNGEYEKAMSYLGQEE